MKVDVAVREAKSKDEPSITSSSNLPAKLTNQALVSTVSKRREIHPDWLIASQTVIWLGVESLVMWGVFALSHSALVTVLVTLTLVTAVALAASR